MVKVTNKEIYALPDDLNQFIDTPYKFYKHNSNGSTAEVPDGPDNNRSLHVATDSTMELIQDADFQKGLYLKRVSTWIDQASIEQLERVFDTIESFGFKHKKFRKRVRFVRHED